MWLHVVLTAYFINAGVYIADKFMLSKKIHSSLAYAFFVGIWSIFNVVILALDPWVPNAKELAIDLLAGLLFLVTLVFFYKALHQSEATRVIPLVGALTPVFTLIFSYIFLNETLNKEQLLAFLILICGGILVSVKYTRFYAIKEFGKQFRRKFGNMIGGFHASYRPTSRLVINSVASALFFALYYVLIKDIYNHQPFIGAFVWSRFGTFLGVILILFVPDWRALVAKQREYSETPGNIFIFILVRLLAAAAFIMINWAISLSNAAMVNAVQGAQYVFLFAMVLFISAKYPKFLQEELGGGVLFQKVIGVILVGIGLYMLAGF